MRFKQEMGAQLESTQRRKAERREDLLRIAGATGISRTNLNNPTRWNEVARGEMSYEPDRALVAMVRDVARTARQRCTTAQQQAVRRAITLYCCRTLLNEMLEPLGAEDYKGNVIELFQASVKEQSDAECAAAIALQAPHPENDQRAAREFEEAAEADKKMAETLRERMSRAIRNIADNGYVKSWQ